MPKRRDLRALCLKLALSVGGVAFCAYLGSYAAFSWLYRAEALAAGQPAFFYVPVDLYYSSAAGEAKHAQRRRFYAPLNWIDVEVFGGMPAARGGVRQLISGDTG